MPAGSRSVRSGLTLLLVVALALPVSGCGFRLRGSETLSAGFPQLQLNLQQPGSEMAVLLRRTLRDAGVTLIEPDPDSFDVNLPLLSIGAEQLTVRPITVTARARAAQYDMQLLLPVSLSAGEIPLLEPEELTVQQVYYENTGNITGTLEEREVIQDEMRRQLINLLLRRLDGLAARQQGS